MDKLSNINDNLFIIDKSQIANIFQKGFDYHTEEDLEQDDIEVKSLHIINTSFDDIKARLEKENMICVINAPTIINYDTKENASITLNESFKSLISQANKEIKIISPFIDKYGVVQYLYDFNEACRKGVNIKLLTRNDGGDKGKGIRHLCDAFNDIESRNIIEIRTFHKRYNNEQLYSIHAKMLIIDNSFGYIGSGEFRGNSIWGLVEAGIIIKTPFINPFINLYEQVWNKSDVLWKK